MKRSATFPLLMLIGLTLFAIAGVARAPSAQAQSPGPDLRVEFKHKDGRIPAKVLDVDGATCEIEIPVTVFNEGRKGAPPFEVEAIGRRPPKTKPASPGPPGADGETDVHLTAVIDKGTSYPLHVQVDRGDKVPESDEGNNRTETRVWICHEDAKAGDWLEPGAELPAIANVTGGDSAPHFECKWELPDMDPEAPGMQYVRINEETGDHLHDDDVSVAPDADNDSDNGTQVPCDLGPPNGFPEMPSPAHPDGQPDGVQRMIQVTPNLEDDPAERTVELWAAVDHSNGISNIGEVYWTVFRPDGSEHVQAQGEKVSVEECGDMGTSSGPDGSPLHAAYHTGQVSAEAIDDPNAGLVARCQGEVKALYHQTFAISKDQPCGEYRVEATAVASGGATEKLNSYIDVACVFGLEVDFDSVDWGTVSPGKTDIVGGDLAWDDPPANAPTVQNIGNDGMGLRLEFTEMVGATDGKTIDEFGAGFGRSAETLKSIDSISAGDVEDFGTEAEQVLCANELGKLDLSIHPPHVLPADSYSGQLTVTGYHVPGECAGDAHL